MLPEIDGSARCFLACARFGLDVISMDPLGLAETETDIHSGELNPVDHETILSRVGFIGGSFCPAGYVAEVDKGIHAVPELDPCAY